MYNPCKFQHVLWECRGKHPRAMCPLKGLSKDLKGSQLCARGWSEAVIFHRLLIVKVFMYQFFLTTATQRLSLFCLTNVLRRQ